MTPTSRTGSIRCLLLVCVVLLVPGRSVVTAQDAVEHFEEGLAHFEDEEWPEAIEQFQAAIKADPAESTRRVGGFLGLGRREYAPHLYLGRSYFGAGNCAAALSSWEESARQGVATKNKEYLNALTTGTNTCVERGYLPKDRVDAETRRVTELITAAEAAVKAVPRPGTTDAWTPELRTQQERAATGVGSARKRLDAARNSRRAQDFNDAASAAEGARNDAVVVAAALAKYIDGANRADRLLREAEGILDETGRLEREVSEFFTTPAFKAALTPALADSRRRLTDAVNRARERTEAGGRSRSDTDLADAVRLATEARTVARTLVTEIGRERQALDERALRAATTAASAAMAAVDGRLADVRTRMEQLSPEAQSKVVAGLKPIETALTRARRRQQAGTSGNRVDEVRAAQAEVQRLHGAIDALAPLLGVAVQVVPDGLRAAAQAYFDGKYDDALRRLTAGDAAAVALPLRLHAHLFRAAALFALYEYSGRTDTARAQDARREIDIIRKADPTFEPDPGAFGPKFRAFFSGAAGS